MRTEEQKLIQDPILVILGGEEYKVKPLVIRDSREWRGKVGKLLATLPQYSKTTSDEPDKFESAITALLITMPDAVIDLFFDYAKELDREQIEAAANDAEIARAFQQVVEIAFPLAGSLVGTMQRLAR